VVAGLTYGKEVCAMSSITVDAALRDKLSNLLKSVEVRDEAGNVLGYFTPKFDPSKWEETGPEVSEEEMRRREQSNEPRYTTAEVLDYLRKL
jgi:hypothetical protein